MVEVFELVVDGFVEVVEVAELVERVGMAGLVGKVEEGRYLLSLLFLGLVFGFVLEIVLELVSAFEILQEFVVGRNHLICFFAFLVFLALGLFLCALCLVL